MIDRTGAKWHFTFDGKSYAGVPGDTLASALLANGVHLFARSFKYHRPRGVLGAGAEEPNALVDIAGPNGRTTPNLRATTVELYDGLVATSQNRYPSLRFDIGAINNLLSPLLGAGFYYKTFMHPRGAWAKLYEPIIRRAAGLGQAPTQPDPDHYAQRYAHCETLIVGAGPAGLVAALAAAQSGERVIVCDEQAEPGGALLAETRATIDGKPAAVWLAETLATLAALPNVRLLPRTTAFGYFHQNLLGLVERVTDHLASPEPALPRERLWQVRARDVVLATGAIERPLVFAGNDRPGVMLASAARLYLNRYGVAVGRRVVLFTADDSAYAAALDLHAAGVGIVAIVDLRPNPTGPGVDAARAAGLTLMPGTAVIATTGHLRITGARLSSNTTLACDALLMGGGWTPSVHLFSQSRGKLRFDDARQIYLPGSPAQRQTSVGGANGVLSLASILAPLPVTGDIPAQGGFLGLVPGSTAAGFVDYQNDVKASDIIQATREGFRSIEHVKRYTTSGMATDQGKTSNMNALAIAADALALPLQHVGLTSFRNPYTPATFGSLAGHARGDLFDPVRKTPIHPWAAAQGAAFEDVGLWKRAWYFQHVGETMHDAVKRECATVRRAAGLFDASTLGKIEVVGPDAAEFLNRLYTNSWTKLGVGSCRYGLMLTEAGFVMDDGVVGRLAPDRFHVTTTTGGAARVLGHMEDYLQTEFPDLRVWLTSTTEHWAVIAIQGPRARDILAPLIDDIDLAAMPHMSVREGHIAGIPTRLFRVSFTGELGYEVNVPAGHGQAIWELLWAAGAQYDACAYGTEAMHVLRAEKGYIVVGQETDGTVTPHDLGLGWAIAKSKPDFVGKRSLAMPDLLAANRPQLVGLLPAHLPQEGAQIVDRPDPPTGSAALGHVTSAYDSATIGRPIALALIADGRQRLGQTIHITTATGTMPATIVDPVFYDKEGTRLHA